jgi:hypothetical protein
MESYPVFYRTVVTDYLDGIGQEALRMQGMEVKKSLSVNCNPKLDPDFGKTKLQDANAFLVSVTPTPNKAHAATLGFYIIILVPLTEASSESQGLITEVLHYFLQEGDYYDVRPFGEEDLGKYSKETPVISFDPAKAYNGQEHAIEELFFWLTPPRYLMH